MAKGKGYTNIPNEEFERIDIKGNVKLIYLILLRFKDNKKNIAFPSQTTLAKYAGISIATAKRCIKTLEDKNILIPIKSLGKNNIYTFNDQYQNDTSITMTPVSNLAHTSIKMIPEPVSKRATIITNDKNTNTIKKEINKEKEKIPYKEIVEFLNETLGKSNGSGFKHTTKKTQEKIRARWNEGFRLVDFKEVIRKTCINWKGKTWTDKQGKQVDAEQYLTPLTLFNEKFENRLHAKITPQYEMYVPYHQPFDDDDD